MNDALRAQIRQSTGADRLQLVEDLQWARRTAAVYRGEADILRRMIEHHKKDWIMIRFFKGRGNWFLRNFWRGVHIGIDAGFSTHCGRFTWYTWRRLSFGFRTSGRWRNLVLDIGPLAVTLRRGARR